MNFVLSVEHPAWAHQFRHIIKELERRGHKVKVLAIKMDVNLELLDKFGISYEKVADSTGRGVLQKGWLLFAVTVRMILKCRGYKSDCFIGRASPMMAMAAAWYRKPHVIFEDTELSTISLFFCKLFSKIIITSTSFNKDLGPKQRRFPIFKELFYLHPAHFNPDPSVLKEIGVSEGERFSLIRMVAWSAEHDIGHKGLTMETKLKAVREFEKYGKVFITTEVPLAPELEKYRIKVAPEKLHHVLYYATVLYGGSATMATECAVLGTHAIFCYFAHIGSTDELQNRYGLVFNFMADEKSQVVSVEKGCELLRTSNTWEQGKIKRKKILNEMRNGTEVFLEQLRTIVNI